MGYVVLQDDRYGLEAELYGSKEEAQRRAVELILGRMHENLSEEEQRELCELILTGQWADVLDCWYELQVETDKGIFLSVVQLEPQSGAPSRDELYRRAKEQSDKT